ncbi:MAG: hypothetical protein ACJA1B_002140 [Polaribacter sp.]|jgi:hypothetical protein
MLKNNIFLAKILIFLLFATNILNAQTEFKNKKIDSLFIKYTSLYQEVSYAHLNKTTYLKGDMLGFTAYVFEKQTKLLSNATTNLYCKILDGNNTVIKEKLILVKNGIANDDFTIDDKFKERNYTFVVFTN